MVGWDVVLLVTCIEVKSLDHLVSIIHTGDALGLSLGLGQRWQKHTGKNGDDGYHHQQLDEGETGEMSCRFHDQ